MTPNPTFTIFLVVALATGAAQTATAAGTRDAAAPLESVAQARALLEAIHHSPWTYEGALAIGKTIGTLTPEGWSEPVEPNYGDLATQASTLAGPALARAATRAQAEALHLDLTSVAMPGHETPSAAVRAFLEAQGAQLPAGQETRALQLDALPPAQASALARVIAAFTAMESATGAWMISGEPGMRAGVFSARLSLLDAVADLQATLPAEPTTASSSGPATLSVPPFLRVAAVPSNDVVLENYVLNVDIGGDDDYQNNAGGTWFGNCDLPAHAAASVDLGLGSDAYNAGAYRLDSCGKNGGSMGGAGFLYDDGALLGSWPWGDRLGSSGLHNGINGGAAGPGAIGFAFAPGAVQVDAGDTGTNGGAANAAVGCLVAAGQVTGGNWGTNGGGANAGYGLMVGSFAARAQDFGTNGGAFGAGSVGLAIGTGSFQAGSYGTNGGGSQAGAGSAVGGVSYWAGHGGTNGGGHQLGTGAAYGAGASYESWGGEGVNGGGNAGGRGTIVDPLASSLRAAGGHGANGGAHGLGSSGFVWGGTQFAAAGSGANGGGSDGGVGTLVAGGLGAWSYSASGTGVNGGGADAGVGHLVDPGLGSASYYAPGGDGSNGGATRSGTGYLLDAAGNDAYAGGSGGANGGASSGSQGQLIDLEGSDAYSAGSQGVNGGAHSLSSVGLLVDVSGNDSYTASCSGSNGGAWAGPASALLFDGQGHDWYSDCVSTGWDQLVVTKGTVGAQIDTVPL